MAPVISAGVRGPTSRDPRAGRYVAMAGALLAWASLVLQLVLIITYTQRRGLSPLDGVLNFLSFFTILTNILVAIVLTHAALRPFSRGILARPDIRSAVAVYIVMVGIVYSLLLRHIWAPLGAQRVADHLLHDVMPPLYVAYWLLFVPKGTLRWAHALKWLAYPAAYFAIMLTRGELTGRYPYPFLDLARIGWAGLVQNAAILLAAFVVAGWVCVAIDRLMAARRARPAGESWTLPGTR